METIVECPLCGNTAFSDYLVCKDYLVSEENFTIQQCTICGFRLTNPRPDIDSISNYYKSIDYISHNDKSGGLINSLYRLVRNYTLKSKIKLIEELNEGVGRILDVGCGTGAFLESCEKNGWQVKGIEPDTEVRINTQNRLHIEIQSDLNEVVAEKPFNIITLWHVLEHIPDLARALKQISHLLASKGKLIIALPNSDSFDACYFNKNWAAYDVPRHLYHFTPYTMKALLKQYGFQLLDTKPMVFDAFYIALLSTRYKTGKTDYLKSIRIGLLSNLKARKTGNSSSIIYVIKRLE